jgi:hypothetical protein
MSQEISSRRHSITGVCVRSSFYGQNELDDHYKSVIYARVDTEPCTGGMSSSECHKLI